MVRTKPLLTLPDAPHGGHHTARRPALEPLIAPAVEAVRDHAEEREVSLVVRKAALGARNLDSTLRETPKVKGPIRCHKCQLNCADADHYLSHKCEPRRVIG